MAKLYFYYAAMNAGKSTVLLQSAHNYRERGMHVAMLTSAIDDRYAEGFISSRIGIKSEADVFDKNTNILEYMKSRLEHELISCLLVDEAQFLTPQQVHQLGMVVDMLRIPVLAYGLRTDFKGNLFPGSQALLAWAEELIELKTICRCGRKATMNGRLDSEGNVVSSGDQVEIGGNDRYESLCRRCFTAQIDVLESQTT